MLGNAYAKNGFIVIQNILEDKLAADLHKALTELNWFLEIKDYQESRLIRIPYSEVRSPQNLLGVLDDIDHQLDRGKLFFMRLCANLDEFNNKCLDDFAAYLNTESFLAPIRQIVGKPEATQVWVEATCYDTDCFLSTHRDDHHPGNLVAFVLNFTRAWQLDWGGLLMIQKSSNVPPMIIPPIWNSLAMFSIPVDHHVSCVSPAATGKRYSLTGWLRP